MADHSGLSTARSSTRAGASGEHVNTRDPSVRTPARRDQLAATRLIAVDPDRVAHYPSELRAAVLRHLNQVIGNSTVQRILAGESRVVQRDYRQGAAAGNPLMSPGIRLAAKFAAGVALSIKKTSVIANAVKIGYTVPDVFDALETAFNLANRRIPGKQEAEKVRDRALSVETQCDALISDIEASQWDLLQSGFTKAPDVDAVRQIIATTANLISDLETLANQVHDEMLKVKKKARVARETASTLGDLLEAKSTTGLSTAILSSTSLQAKLFTGWLSATEAAGPLEVGADAAEQTEKKLRAKITSLASWQKQWVAILQSKAS